MSSGHWVSADARCGRPDKPHNGNTSETPREPLRQTELAFDCFCKKEKTSLLFRPSACCSQRHGRTRLVVWILQSTAVGKQEVGRRSPRCDGGESDWLKGERIETLLSEVSHGGTFLSSHTLLLLNTTFCALKHCSPDCRAEGDVVPSLVCVVNLILRPLGQHAVPRRYERRRDRGFHCRRAEQLIDPALSGLSRRSRKRDSFRRLHA